MRKTKILMVMTALVLVVVGVLVAVTSVLSATQQSVTSSLQVTYVANNVSAEVSVKGKTQGGSYAAAASGTTSYTFTPSMSQVAQGVSLAAPVLNLGFSRSEGEFDRYAVYQFKFINKYTKNHGCDLYITMTDDYNIAGKNVIVRYAVTDETEPDITLVESSGVATGVSGESSTNTAKNVWLSVKPGKTTLAVTDGDNLTEIYFYVLVIVADPTLPISSYENNSISFTLNTSSN